MSGPFEWQEPHQKYDIKSPPSTGARGQSAKDREAYIQFGTEYILKHEDSV